MKKIYIILIIFFLFNVFFIKEINSISNTEFYNFTGTFMLFNRLIEIELFHNGALIEGNFYKKRSGGFGKTEFLVKLLLNNKKYVGSVYRVSPMFKKTYYEVDLSINNIPFKGEINIEYKGNTRSDSIKLKYNEKNIDGTMVYDRVKNRVILSLDYGDKKVNGVYNKKSGEHYVNIIIGEGKILGRIDRSSLKDFYYLKTENIFDLDDLFLFLFFEIYQKIDNFPSDSSFDSSNQ